MNTTTHPATNRGESLNPLDNIDIIDITYRETSAFKMSGRPVIKTSEDIIDTCLHYWNTAGITEGVIALFLNESYKVLELYPAFEGKFTETSVDPVRIIEKALGTGRGCKAF
jgi:DNA repair protein RadC